MICGSDAGNAAIKKQPTAYAKTLFLCSASVSMDKRTVHATGCNLLFCILRAMF